MNEQSYTWRQSEYNYDYKNGKKFKLYEECKKHNIEKIKCILLEEVDINDKLELSIIEQKYIEELKPNLNMVSAHLSLIENRRKSNIRRKKYYEEHKDKILEKKKNNIRECDICGLKMNKESINRHKLRKHQNL